MFMFVLIFENSCQCDLAVAKECQRPSDSPRDSPRPWYLRVYGRSMGYEVQIFTRDLQPTWHICSACGQRHGFGLHALWLWGNLTSGFDYRDTV